MREIKFRAKAIEKMASGNQWIYGFGVLKVDRTDEAEEWQIYSACNSPVEIDSKTIGQCTGMKDKHRKDIYEGDIVVFDCYSYEEPENAYTGEIVYSNGNACFCLNGVSESGAHEYLPLCEIGGSYKTIVEILGNIHDNPELLQEGE